MAKRFQGIIFDFDGTLVDTFPGIFSAWDRTFKLLNLGPLPPERVKKAIGPTKDAYLRIILEDLYNSHGQIALETFRGIYKSESIYATTLFPGIPELLETLDNTGIRMGIASNKPFTQVMKLVEHFGLADCFSPILGPEKVKDGKPAPDMLLECGREWDLPAARLLVAGDTDMDLIAGRNAGMARAAVLWGYSEKRILMAHSPEYCVNAPAELGEIILGAAELQPERMQG
jgi:HAD superfamily hydrolase (TIGR01549 family)